MSEWRKSGVVLEGDRGDDDLRVLCPCVLPLACGDYRLFYMGHGRASPSGTKGRILSAVSEDGVRWAKEPGVRVDHHDGAELRVLSPCVVPMDRGYRMYFEAVSARGTSIRSAVSHDAMRFRVEAGARVELAGRTVGSPRALLLPSGRVRLYFHAYPQPFRIGLEHENHVLSAISDDGVVFSPEAGVRIAQTLPGLEDEAVYCAQPVASGCATIWVFYGAWNGNSRARGAIMSAVSHDGGLTFTKSEVPCVKPDGVYDSTFASEPSVFADPNGRVRMIYEASDARGTTRLLAAERILAQSGAGAATP